MIVICDGMIRAGSTLQYNVARRLSELLGAGYGEHALRAQFDVSTQISDAELYALASDSVRYIFKVHSLNEWVHPSVYGFVPPGSFRVCTIYRDLRDVAVSARRKWQYAWDELLSVLDEQIRDSADLDALPDAIPLLSQQYETVLWDMPAAIREVAAFLDLTPSDEVVRQVADECSVESAQANMKKVRAGLSGMAHEISKKDPAAAQRILQMASNGKLDLLDQTTLIHYNHISRTLGASGVWKTALTDDEARQITQRYWEWLVTKGYESAERFDYWHPGEPDSVAV